LPVEKSERAKSALKRNAAVFHEARTSAARRRDESVIDSRAAIDRARCGPAWRSFAESISPLLARSIDRPQMRCSRAREPRG